MNTIAIGIGTNQGDRILSVSIVLKKMLHHGLKIIKVSSLYESEAFGYQSDNLFINAVVKVETQLNPFEVLEILMGIEEEMGRIRLQEGYSDRPMDLDILAVGKEIIDTENLQVPHPRIINRAFVLVPFYEVWSDWQHPKLGVSIELMVQKVQHQILKKIEFESLI
jgi:2-amino-4-hydroxy-6-hydroxymethyldihydropteridine diphosphokinase